ncbi:MAG TPA: DNA polymerase III subunit alpha [Candidatus Omnitrophota bacterium]|nr:DNA polymerase III subunit alpha [Candidatus Omnitrophota bacterium]
MTQSGCDFVHLHVHTQYSLLDGACRLDELLDRTKQFNMTSCAITDHGNMFGAVEFYEKALDRGIKPIMGAEIYLAPESRFDKTSHGVKGAGFHLVLLAQDAVGYNNLINIVSIGFLEGFYYKPRADKEVLAKYSKGLFALSACLKGEVSHYLLTDQYKTAKKAALEYADIFGKGNFYLEVQDNNLDEQSKLNKELVKLAKETSIPLVATNDVHYLEQSDARAHDALICIQTQSTLNQTDRMKFQTDQLFYKSQEEMKRAFSEIPEAIKNTVDIAAKCDVKFDFKKLHLPSFTAPDNRNNDEYLYQLISDGVKKRYPVMTEEIEKRVAHEFDIIKRQGYVSYFLIVWDFINKAKQMNIPVGPGRGSAAGSLVSYAVGITDIDPLKYGLIFERFLNPSRVSMPDIDIDFCFERRSEIIDYVISKYSKENVAQIITFGTMMAKGVIRDVGRVMGLAYEEVDKIAKLVPTDLGITLDEALEKEPELKKIYDTDPVIKELIDVSKRLEGLNRHASTHAAGIVISDKPLHERIPLYKTADGQISTGFTMSSLEKIGMLKMDFLGLKTLTVIDQAVKIVKRTRSVDLDFSKIPLDDEKTFGLFWKGETTGVFQLESSGMKDLLRKIHPDSFEDLISILALYRPGPLGSGMVEEFIKRKSGELVFTYEHPALEPILKETYGVIIYQEQVMKIVSALAGFSMAEADNVRKVMSKKKPEAMAKIKTQFMEGSAKNNVDPAVAAKIFDQIEYFAGYGFNKSHSTAYAVVSYRTAYLKANYPIEFMTALLASEKNNTDKVSEYIGESIRMGIEILPPDINESFKDFTVVGTGIRFGLVAVKNVGEGAVESIIDARKKSGKFTSIYDFAEKVDTRTVNKKVIESLIKCGAFDLTKIFRSQGMAVLDKVLELAQKVQKDRFKGQLSFFDEGQAIENFKGSFHDIPEIPEWNESELLASEKEMLGFYISKHPLAKYEKILNSYSTCKISELSGLSDGQKVLIGGLINKVRITVTRKKGEKMAIVRLEDLDNFVEVLVFPRAYQKCADLVLEDALVYIDGTINLRESDPKIIAEDIIPLEKVKELFTKSVVIKLMTTGLEEKLMSRIKHIIKSHKGNIPVFVDLLSSEGRKVRLSVDKELAISPTNEFIAETESLIGAGNVKFIVK